MFVGQIALSLIRFIRHRRLFPIQRRWQRSYSALRLDCVCNAVVRGCLLLTPSHLMMRWLIPARLHRLIPRLLHRLITRSLLRRFRPLARPPLRLHLMLSALIPPRSARHPLIDTLRRL